MRRQRRLVCAPREPRHRYRHRWDALGSLAAPADEHWILSEGSRRCPDPISTFLSSAKLERETGFEPATNSLEGWPLNPRKAFTCRAYVLSARWLVTYLVTYESSLAPRQGCVVSLSSPLPVKAVVRLSWERRQLARAHGRPILASVSSRAAAMTPITLRLPATQPRPGHGPDTALAGEVARLEAERTQAGRASSTAG